MNPFVYSQLHLLNDWTQQGDSQGAHGTCPIIPGTLISPMKALFTPAVRPQGQPWDNVYILQRNAFQNSTLFNYITNVMFPTQQDINNCNAFEMDFQMNNGASIINLGWQALFGTGWRIWDRSFNNGAGEWVGPVLPIDGFTPGVAIDIIHSFSVDYSSINGSLTYNGMAVNGLWSPFTYSFPTVASVQHQYLNNAIQLDSKGHGAPIALNINEVSITGF